MKKYKAGSLIFSEEETENYYTDDFKKFYKENGEELSNEELKYWAVWVNSPWSQAHEHYQISPNCKDAYTQMDKNNPAWRCEYYIVGYDGISASIFGYGDETEIQSLKDCINNFQFLQYQYNPDKENF